MRTNNSTFTTIIVLPHNAARRGVTVDLTDTPTLRFITEGASLTGLAADQIVISQGCDYQSNEFAVWFRDLVSRVNPGGRSIVL